jgi:hypothetical protein
LSDEDDPPNLEPEQPLWVDDPDAEPEPADDAVDPEQQRRKKRKLARARDEADAFWRGVLGTQPGRREIWKILDAGHAFDQRFECGPSGFPQSEATWFRAGEQAFAWRLYDYLQTVDYMGVYLMRCENDPRFVNAARPVAK